MTARITRYTPNTALQRTRAAVSLQNVPRELSTPGRRRAPLSLGPFGATLLRHGATAAFAMLSILACTASRTLNLAFVPELGEKLHAGPAHRLLMTSPANLRPVYDVLVGQTTYQVCTSPDGHVVYVDTQDSRFRTPEGLGVGTSLAKVRRVTTAQPFCEPGWATWLSLPSGWKAAFIGPQDCPEPLSEDSPVSFFFQRRA